MRRRTIIVGGVGVAVAAAVAAVFLFSLDAGFVASRTSNVFHLLSCRWVKRISPENRGFYQTYQEAIDDGKRPCKTCNPDEIPVASVERVTIAVWNIRDFSDTSRDPQELKQICSIFRKYDLIAIIEQLDEDVLIRAVAALEELGKSYGYEFCKEDVGNGERYAFLYDNSLFQVVEPGIKWPDDNNEFRFDPYYATFKAGNFDFTMILTHIRWSGRIAERRAELNKLAVVFTAVQNANGNEQDIILAGDFNAEPDDHGYDNLKAIAGIMPVFLPPLKSKFSRTRETALYDNIWFQSNYVQEYTGESGIDKFDESMFGGDYKAATLAVSDHRPVWAVFHGNMDDDDGVATP